MVRVGWVTAQIHYVLLLLSTPTGRGIDLAHRYNYQRHTVIRHIHPDDGDRKYLGN
jgi:hypothetical protein